MGHIMQNSLFRCFSMYIYILYVYLRIRSASSPLKRKFRQLSQFFVILPESKNGSVSELFGFYPDCDVTGG